MATAPPVIRGNPNYPTSSPEPMPETDYHRKLMVSLIQTLDGWLADDPNAYASGNILVFYERGNRRRHISPDVLVVKGVPKGDRLNFIVWEEGKAPDLVIELTSATTRLEDVDSKFDLYQDTLHVPEYFLFDPLGDYLDPPLVGYRLRRGKYVPIRMVKGRLPSQVLGLHLEQDEETLRLYDPAAKRWLPTMAEELTEVKAENERLRRENDELRRQARRH